MILPSKHLKYDRALIGIGADVLQAIDDEYTVSELWERVQKSRPFKASPISYDWFVLVLGFLYTVDAISYERGLIRIGGGSVTEH